MTRSSWFDDDGNLPRIQEQAEKLESFTAAMADGVIDENELAEQTERLVAAMKKVEPELDDSLHEDVTDLLLELSAYNIMRMLHELRGAQLRMAFSGD